MSDEKDKAKEVETQQPRQPKMGNYKLDSDGLPSVQPARHAAKMAKAVK